MKWQLIMADMDARQAFETHQRLKAELRIRGTSLAQIARDLGVSGTSMSLVGLGKHRSRRIERAIAQALGTDPEQLWPDRYPEKTKQRGELK